MLSVEEGYRALREGTDERDSVGAVVPRDFISVSGEDALDYLQGQVSQDLSAMAVLGSRWSLLLEPTGKLGWWLRVSRRANDDPNDLVIDLDAGAGEGALARLTRFTLRAKVSFELVPPGAFHCWAQDRSNGARPARVDGSDNFAAPWPGASGWDHICTQDEPPSPTRLVPFEAYDAIRIEAGVPAGAELTGDVIPAELGQWLIDTSVSFTKGCYTGQELVARIDSRGGNVARHLRGLVVGGDHVPAVGSEIVVGDKVAGAVTSAAWSPGLQAPVALAFVHRSVEPPAPAELRTPDGSTMTAEVRALPLV
jgi:folate-binding protein YgfZ